MDIFSKNTILLCDGIMYTPNAGNIVRNCGLLKTDLIIFCNNEYSNTFKKTLLHYSMNNPSKVETLFNLDITSIILSAIFNKYKIIVLETGGQSIFNTDLSAEKILFIVGNEHNGVSRDVLQCVEKGFAEIVTIPSGSLNVSFAATLAVYERMRQLA
jgi:tRNA G18 (ribose-2'-O)-methylase SpoU